MRLSKTTNYAIRILLDCVAANGALVKVADVSLRRDITLQNTFKIVHLLSRAGFIHAVRGRNGGVRLARPASEIRVGEVVRAIERLRVEAEDDSAGAAGVLDELFDSAMEAFISVLDGHTLEEMAKAKRSPMLAQRSSLDAPEDAPEDEREIEAVCALRPARRPAADQLRAKRATATRSRARTSM